MASFTGEATTIIRALDIADIGAQGWVEKVQRLFDSVLSGARVFADGCGWRGTLDKLQGLDATLSGDC
jgi:hypothetical protein